jgi:16S rRNA (guanine966-N2)-methyltransferase
VLLLRVIAGKAGGRRLKSPKGLSTRPTADRVKEAVFSALSLCVEGAFVLDAFAGSGALGIEALSRGAEKAVFIEENPAAIAAVRENIEALGFQHSSLVYKGSCAAVIPRLKKPFKDKFTLVFLDPPYNRGCLNKVFNILPLTGILKEGSIVVVETASKNNKESFNANGFEFIKQAEYGDTAVSYLRWKGDALGG